MWESSCNVSEHFNVINKVFGNHGFIFPRIMDAHFETVLIFVLSVLSDCLVLFTVQIRPGFAKVPLY